MDQKNKKLKSVKKLSSIFLFISTWIRKMEKSALKTSKFNLTERELTYIVIIHDSKFIKQEEISEEAGVTKSTMSNLIKLLIHKGYLYFEHNTKDKRKKFIKLTTKGKQAYKLYVNTRLQIWKKYESKFTLKEIKTFFKLGTKIFNVIRNK